MANVLFQQAGFSVAVWKITPPQMPLVRGSHMLFVVDLRLEINTFATTTTARGALTSAVDECML